MEPECAVTGLKEASQVFFLALRPMIGLRCKRCRWLAALFSLPPAQGTRLLRVGSLLCLACKGRVSPTTLLVRLHLQLDMQRCGPFSCASARWGCLKAST